MLTVYKEGLCSSWDPILSMGHLWPPLKVGSWGTWVAQSVRRLTGSGHDLTVHGFKPYIGLAAVIPEPTSDPLSPSLSAPPLLALSLSKINKHLKRKGVRCSTN